MQIIDGVINAGQKLKGSFRYNEDWMCHGRNFAAVFDGATFKGQSAVARDAFTDAAWCAQTAAHLLSSVIQRTQKPDNIYTEICDKLSSTYQSITGIDPLSLAHDKRPSTTMSCAVQFGNTVRIIQIGDSPVIVERINGDVEEFLGDPVLLRQDEAIRQDIGELWMDNPHLSYAEILKMRKTPSIRDKMNIAGGYGVLTVVKPDALNMTVKDFDIRHIKSILLATDGLSEVYDTFNICQSPKDLFKTLRKKGGLKSIITALRQEQIKDRQCQDYPRAKIGDDVTALLIKPSL